MCCNIYLLRLIFHICVVMISYSVVKSVQFFPL
jgi:hypothetical protein